MSRIKSDKINLGASIVINFPEERLKSISLQNENIKQKKDWSEAQRIVDEAKLEAEEILNAARAQAEKIVESARFESETVKGEAEKIVEGANSECIQLKEAAKEEIEALKQQATADGAKEGFEAGYADGEEKIRQEMQEKIQSIDNAAKTAIQIRKKMLEASKREIVELVLLIARKICINSVDVDSIGLVVQQALPLLSDKDDIELILSQKYALLFNEVLNGKSSQQIDVDKLKNIKITYNSKLDDDTIVVQTPNERLDLAFSSQLDEISRNFMHGLDSGEVND